jgi:hypothetical protein
MLASICQPARQSRGRRVAGTLMVACAVAVASVHQLAHKLTSKTKLHESYKAKEKLLLSATVSPSKAQGAVVFYQKGPCKAEGKCELPFVKLGSATLKAGVADLTTEYDGLPKRPGEDGTFPDVLYFKATYEGSKTYEESTSSTISVGTCGGPLDPSSLVQRRC